MAYGTVVRFPTTGGAEPATFAFNASLKNWDTFSFVLASLLFSCHGFKSLSLINLVFWWKHGVALT